MWEPPRWFSQREEESVDDQVEELFEMGATRRSTSSFGRAIVAVEQKGKKTVTGLFHRRSIFGLSGLF